MSRGCDSTVGNGKNDNGYVLKMYNVLRRNLYNFPSQPVACNNQHPYRLFIILLIMY